MKPLVFTIFGILVSTTALADVSELTQADLRRAIAENRAIPTRSLISGVENFTGGEVVDIRAFFDGTALVYRILYRGEDGGVATLLVDGGTGRAVESASDVGQAIAAFVGSNPSSGNGNAFGLANNRNGIGNGRNNGNNGRGNNNSGGSGGGNSGGGNSGGGNSGGGRDR